MKNWIIKNIISPIVKWKYDLISKIAKNQIEDARISGYEKGWEDGYDIRLSISN